MNQESVNQFNALVEESPVRCADKKSEAEMIRAIEQAKSEGESLGGSFEVGAVAVPPDWAAMLAGSISLMVRLLPLW